MDFLSQPAFLKALGWSLVNSSWQFGVLWLVYATVAASKKDISAIVKHSLALVLLCSGFLWFIVTLCVKYFAYTHDAGDQTGNFVFTFLSEAKYSDTYASVTGFIDRSLPYLSLVYLAIVLFQSVKFFRSYYYISRLQSTGLTKVDASLRLFVKDLVARMNVKKKVSVWASALVDSPVIIGVLKPMILLPVAAVNQLSTQQLEAVLLHEMSHIRRNDYFINLLISAIEILFFFNPFTRMLIRHIRKEREDSCDDMVLQFRYDAHQYASALLMLEQNRSRQMALAVAAIGTDKNVLLQRIRRIMQVPAPDPERKNKFAACLFAVLLLGTIAFVKPGEIVIEKLANNFEPIKEIFYPNEFAVPIVNKTKVSEEPVFEEVARPKEKITLKKQIPEAEAILTDAMQVDFVSDADDPDEEAAAAAVTFATTKEQRNFSVNDPATSATHPSMHLYELPYVPGSSFSYYFRQDTSKPAKKQTSYSEFQANEAHLKTQKALEKINWEKIQKELKVSKTELAKLKAEVEKELAEVNWQVINQEAQAEMNKARLQAARDAARQREELRTYQQNAAYLEALQKELQLNQESLNDNEKIQGESIRKIEGTLKKVETQPKKTTKKKAIIYI